ncbi:MAG TPA: hypothetical protein VFX59_08430 [Polyangiales bacterium]|nr:hypothetical protein [Polyangiales bacterium]
MRWQWFGVACALIVVACGGAQRGGRADEDQRLGPLLPLLPSGPSWVIQAHPRALAEQQATLSLWRALVPEDRERAFQERTGVAPLQVDEAVGCELPPHGWLILARGAFDADQVVERAGERLAVPDVRSDEPLKRREGLAGQGRYAYAALSPHVLLVAKDAPPDWLAKLFARRAATLEGRPNAQMPGLVDDVGPLLAEHAAEPLLLVAPQPLKLEPGTGVSLLFARERALALTVRPTHETLAVAIDMRGEFPPGAENNLRTLARSLSSTQLGRALGFLRVPETMAVRVDDQGATVTFALLARELVAGVRMMFFDDLRTILGN